MNDNRLIDLTISLLPGIDPRGKINLLKNINDEKDLVLMSKSDIEKIIDKSIKNYWNIDEIRKKAEKTFALCEMKNINWVSWNEKEYPPLLRESHDPPPVLYYRGELPNPEKSLLGMVGTRKPTADAAMQALVLARDLAYAGISVVSGLALGIDAMSHRGNLAVPGVPSFAVLGSGADQIYPSSNRHLARKIMESGGAILSEYPPLTRPAKWRFPARNRIIAALSRSVIVVQAPKKSGALITAELAYDQGRDVWVASSGIQNENEISENAGTMKLVQDGAEVVYSVRDVLEKWNIEISDEEFIKKNPVFDKGGSSLAKSMADLLEIEL